MKTKYIIASLGLATLLSFGANAAVHQVNAEQAQNLQPMGTISVSQIGSTPMDMRQEICARRSSLKLKKQALIAIASSN